MKITKSQLKQVIKEELDSVVSEEMRMPISGSPDDPMARIAEIERRLEMIEIVIEMNMDTLQSPG